MTYQKVIDYDAHTQSLTGAVLSLDLTLENADGEQYEVDASDSGYLNEVVEQIEDGGEWVDVDFDGPSRSDVVVQEVAEELPEAAQENN